MSQTHLLEPVQRHSWMTCFSVILLAMTLAMRVAGQETSGKKEDGPDSRQVQMAVEGGLAWLSAHQIKEGPQAGSWDSPRNPTAVASLAGLAFLANGHLPGSGEYGKVLERTMKYVQAGMDAEGFAGAGGGTAYDSMYAHAISTLFALSYLGMSPDGDYEKELALWCQKSIRLILQAQKVRKRAAEQGGWRYSPQSDDSDVSVTSWQLLVLFSARQCGYDVPDSAIDEALKYTNSGFMEKSKDEVGFVYRPGISMAPEPGVSGAVILVKSLLEKETDSKQEKAMGFIRRFPPTWGGEQYKGYFYFTSFYMTQGMFQMGEQPWIDFSKGLRKVLVEHQEGDGSWGFPSDNRLQVQTMSLGYSTSLAILMLSLDKQYLPMYQRQKN